LLAKNSSNYQEYLAKSLTDKYGNLSSQMDKIIVDANAEILSLQEKVESITAAYKCLEQKNHDLSDQYIAKSRAHTQTQKLYQTLKAQVMTSQVATAASDSAENTVRAFLAPPLNDRLRTSDGSQTTGMQHMSHIPLHMQDVRGRFQNREPGGDSGRNGPRLRQAQTHLAGFPHSFGINGSQGLQSRKTSVVKVEYVLAKH
jgi:hypothetical protein